MTKSECAYYLRGAGLNKVYVCRDDRIPVVGNGNVSMTYIYYPLLYYSTYFSLTLEDVFSLISSRYYLVSVAESTTA